MTTIEVKTDELTGPALDWAVAMAVGAKLYIGSDGTLQNRPVVWITAGGKMGTMPYDEQWSPSCWWAQGGPLIEEHRCILLPTYDEDDNFNCYVSSPHGGGDEFSYQPKAIGSTPLIAAMRAIVASKLGDVVSVPEELVPPEAQV